jgi:hypothetical protein
MVNWNYLQTPMGLPGITLEVPVNSGGIFWNYLQILVESSEITCKFPRDYLELLVNSRGITWNHW